MPVRPLPSLRALGCASLALAAALAAGPLFSRLLGSGLPDARAGDGDDPFGPVHRNPDGTPMGPPPPSPAAPPSDESRPPDIHAFKGWLNRDDWLCRALAAKELASRSDDGVIAILSAAIAKETDPRVLGVTLRSLAGRPRGDLLAEGGEPLAARLIELLAHASPAVRTRALLALEPFPPVRLPPEPSAFAEWWAKGRAGLAVEARLAVERRAAIAASRAASRGGGALAPGETKTVAPIGTRRYQDLDRITREGLDVVVCLDSTGSMGEVIDAAKRSIVELVRRMRDLAPRFRVGLVTYDDGAEMRLPLTPDESALEREFRKVVADGGGDEEEGVDKAVALAMRAERVGWTQKAMRVILVVGDAPPHEEDVPGMLRTIAKRRFDPFFESPIRIDTISTNGGGDLVPHFAGIAQASGGSAIRLGAARQLAAELLLTPFGPQWREPIRALLADLDQFRLEERAGKR